MDGGWRGGEGGHFLPAKFNRFPQNSTDQSFKTVFCRFSHKIQQIPAKFNRFPQNSTDSHKIQQIPTKFNRSEF